MTEHSRKLLIQSLTRSRSLWTVWDNLPDVVKNEIKEDYFHILEREFRLAIQQERDRCEEIVRTLQNWNDREARADALDLIRYPEPDPFEEPRE